MTIPGPNTITVANTLTRDSGTVLVRKQVTGATEGYVNLGTGAQDFTLHGSCNVPASPAIPTPVRRRHDRRRWRGADHRPASAGRAPGYEDTPSQALLRDASYAWAPAILDPSGVFTLTLAPAGAGVPGPEPDRARDAARSRSTRPSSTRTASSIRPRSTPAPTRASTAPMRRSPGRGRWARARRSRCPTSCSRRCARSPRTPLIRPRCRDGSWTWAAPVISAPATVVAGGTARVTVTNSPQQLWAGLQVTKTVVDTVPSGVLPGATFGGVWTCTQGTGPNETTYSDRFTVAAGGTTVLFSAADLRVPATASCTVIEDTLATQSLRDGSFAWGEPTYSPDPPTVTLVAGQDGVGRHHQHRPAASTPTSTSTRW